MKYNITYTIRNDNNYAPDRCGGVWARHARGPQGRGGRSPRSREIPRYFHSLEHEEISRNPLYNTLYLGQRDDALKEVARLRGVHNAEHIKLLHLRANHSDIAAATFLGVDLGIGIPILLCLGRCSLWWWWVRG